MPALILVPPQELINKDLKHKENIGKLKIKKCGKNREKVYPSVSKIHHAVPWIHFK